MDGYKVEEMCVLQRHRGDYGGNELLFRVLTS